MINTYGMIVAVFLMTNKVNKIRFFEKTFLIANFSLKVVFKIFFLILDGADINFLN